LGWAEYLLGVAVVFAHTTVSKAFLSFDVAVLEKCRFLLISVIWENRLEICLKKNLVRFLASVGSIAVGDKFTLCLIDFPKVKLTLKTKTESGVVSF